MSFLLSAADIKGKPLIEVLSRERNKRVKPSKAIKVINN